MTGAVMDVLAWVLLLAGAFFTLTGALGMLRLPDVFTRMHAGSMTDTMGAGLILVGLCFRAGDPLIVVRLGLILLLLCFTSPISSYALAKAALHVGIRPYTRDRAGEGSEGGQPSRP